MCGDKVLDTDKLVVDELRARMNKVSRKSNTGKHTRATRSTMFSECLYAIVPAKAPWTAEEMLFADSVILLPNWSTS
jgi:hypothetical protein